VQLGGTSEHYELVSDGAVNVSRTFVVVRTLLAAIALGVMLAIGTVSASVVLTSARPRADGAFPSDGSFLGVSADSPSDA
jgi:hypothetical protein